MEIRKGDKVAVIVGEIVAARAMCSVCSGLSGAKGGARGERNPLGDRVTVAGVNLIKKHQRRTGNVNTQFGIIEREAPIHISNVMLICPKCGKPTRVGHKMHADGSRARMCKQCNEPIDA